MMDLAFLDYVWRSLVLLSLISTFILSIMYLGAHFLKNCFSKMQMKFFFNGHLALLLVMLIFGFLFVTSFDPDLATACFDHFVKQGDSYTLTRAISALWILGFCGLILRDSTSIFRSRGTSIEKISSEPFKKVLKKMGISRPVEFYTTSVRTSPYVSGLLKPVVVLPEFLMEKRFKIDLENILAHELIHLRDFDPLWKGFQLFCSRALFFHPLMWRLGREFEKTIELAADEGAVTLGQVNAQSLLHSLIEIVGLCRVTHNDPISLNASRNFIELKERLENLNREQCAPFKNFKTVLIGFLLSASAASWAQAQTVLSDLRSPEREVGGVCQQIDHEKMIERWLHIKPPENKCEDLKEPI